jgi:hypothetical protein
MIPYKPEYKATRYFFNGKFTKVSTKFGMCHLVLRVTPHNFLHIFVKGSHNKMTPLF